MVKGGKDREYCWYSKITASGHLLDTILRVTVAEYAIARTAEVVCIVCSQEHRKQVRPS